MPVATGIFYTTTKKLVALYRFRFPYVLSPQLFISVRMALNLPFILRQHSGFYYFTPYS